MRELGLNPTDAYKKCAASSANVIGKFHPHATSGVRCARPFAQDSRSAIR